MGWEFTVSLASRELRTGICGAWSGACKAGVFKDVRMSSGSYLRLAACHGLFRCLLLTLFLLAIWTLLWLCISHMGDIRCPMSD